MPEAALTSNTVVALALETTRGTSPATGTYEAVPFLEGLEMDPAVKQPSVFQIYDGTRQKSTIVGGAFSVRARLNCALNNELGLKMLLQYGIHAAPPAGGVITGDANLAYFFTLVQKLRCNPDVYVTYRGCEVASFTIEMPLNGACTVSFEIIGTSSTSGAAMPGTATINPLAGKNPYSTGLPGADLMWGSTSGHIGSASITVNNGSNPKYAWGGGGADHVINTNQTTNGRFERYFYDGTITADAIAETERPLLFTLKNSDAAVEDTMTINLPSSKVTSAPIADSAGSQTQQAEFFAQYNAGINSQMQITVG